MNKIDLIIQALEFAAAGSKLPLNRYDAALTAARYDAALVAARELKALEPVAFMCAYKYEITDKKVYYVLDHVSDGKDYMMSRLDDADNDAWRGEPISLYALDEVTK
jgi:hypothetical protein